MSSAAARAEARRKAILGRGTDRLSKLTSTARGEDNPVYSHVDTTTRKAPTTETFIGEETIMPTPPARVSPAPQHPVSASDSTGSGGDDSTRQGPTAWSNEQQQEFLRALMSAPDPSRRTADQGQGQAPFEPAGAGEGDPMSAMLNALAQMTGQVPPGAGTGETNVPGMAAQLPPEVVPKSLFAKLRPLLHLFASWVLLAFFAFFMEPQARESVPGSQLSSTWERWADLAKRSAKAPFGVQPVPFFWAFVTLQLMLHSISILTKSDPVQPPTLLALALPHLPPQFRSLITNLLVYARMFGMLLDDIAGLVVGIGVLIWISSWLASGQ